MINKVDKSEVYNVTEDTSIHRKTWSLFLDKLRKNIKISNYIRNLNNVTSDDIFDVLTNKTKSNPRAVKSLKLFGSKTVEYLGKCPKNTNNAYIVTFMFKILANLCEYSKIIDVNEEIDLEFKKNINENLLDTLDTTKNIKLIFNVLGESMEANIYNEQIFMIGLYYTNKLMNMRSIEVQTKFKIMFLTHPNRENLFSKIERYIKIYISKISNGIFKEKYKNTTYISDESTRSYMIDKSLEKQIVTYAFQLGGKGNTFMQNYLRNQHNNTRSRNIVKLINDILNALTDHLHFPIVYEVFNVSLKGLFEFTQGPNKENQMVLIMSDFVSLANDILMMDFHNDGNPDLGDIEEKNEFNKSSFKSVVSKSMNNILCNNMAWENLKNLYTQTLTQPPNNYLISLAKYRILLVLNQLLDGFEPSHYVFYLFRREVNPEGFRKLLAYQHYYFERYYKSIYSGKIFFNYSQDPALKNPIPGIIENGFMLYFILRKMQPNFHIDPDERYENHIMKLIPFKPRPTTEKDPFLFKAIKDFSKDVGKSIMQSLKRKHSNIIMEDVQAIQNNNNEIRNILKFYAKHTSTVEIIHNGNLQTVYFPRYPHCRYKDIEAKLDFYENVDRSSARTKCRELVRNSEWLDYAYKIEYNITNKIPFLSLWYRHIHLMIQQLFILIFVINVMLTIGYTDGNIGSMSDRKIQIEPMSADQTERIIKILGYYLMFVYFWIMSKDVLVVFCENIARHQIFIEKTQRKVEDKFGFITLRKMKLYRKLFHYFKEYVWKAITHYKVLYHALLVAVGIINLIYDTAALYPVFITFIMYRFQTLKDVLRAVIEPAREISMTMMLYFALVWGASVCIFFYFSSDYNDIVDYGGFNLWSCFVTTFDQGYKSGGGIGSSISNPYHYHGGTDISVETYRLIFDFIVYFVIGVLVFSILTGIIIDKFGELRERRNDLRKDSMSVCFIGGQSAADLDKKIGYSGYYSHIFFQHNMWDYVFFLTYVRTKKGKRKGGITHSERIVYKKYFKDDNSWLPCEYNYSENKEDQAQQQLENSLIRIESKLDHLINQEE